MNASCVRVSPSAPHLTLLPAPEREPIILRTLADCPKVADLERSQVVPDTGYLRHLTCDGCDTDFREDELSSRFGLLMCASCAAKQDLFAVPESFQTRCTGCDRALFKDDDRKNYAICDACAAERGIL